MNWKESPRTTKIEQQPGHIWAGYSPQACGFSSMDAAGFDDFINGIVEMHQKGGWELVNHCISVNRQKVSLRFRDLTPRRFSCTMKGEVKGDITAEKLAQILSQHGIEVIIDDFEAKTVAN